MKMKAFARRYLAYGFSASKDQDGQVVGATFLRLVRRNAYETIGLRRPSAQPQGRFRVG
jgi:hypothetical protein